MSKSVEQAFRMELCLVVFVLAYTVALSSEAKNPALSVPDIDTDLISTGSPEPMNKGYIDAVPIKRGPPKYPRSRALKSQAGMVDVTFMVSAEGAIYETLVQRSTHKAFEERAVEAVEKYIYSPATLNGVPVESRQEIRVLFVMYGAVDAVGDRYHSYYRRINSELTQGRVDVKKIQTLLSKMRETEYLSLYSLAHLAKLESIFSEAHLSSEENLEALKMLLLFEGQIEDDAKFLPPELIANIRQKVIQLNLELGRYGEAMYEYKDLGLGNPEAASVFDKAAAQIADIKKNKKSFSSEVKLGERGYQEINLLADKLRFQDVDGELTELKFRCSCAFGELPYVSEMEFEIPRSWGRCHLQVIGNSGSSAKLIQFY